MDRQKIERSIKGLSEWQMHVQAESDIDTNISTAIEALKAQLSQEGTTSDTISRQAAIDAICTACYSADDEDYTSCEYHTNKESTFCDYMCLLRRVPPAQPEPQWIPVSERVPEEDGKYMVTIHGYGWNGKTFTSVSVAECIGKRWVGNNGVIAWMPLPEPYRKGAND